MGSVKSGGSNKRKDTVIKQDTTSKVPMQKKTECLVSRYEYLPGEGITIKTSRYSISVKVTISPAK